jgi:hypothetical protein
MAKTTFEADTTKITSKELLNSAREFFLRSEANKNAVLVDNINSPNLGSSDLLFVNEAKTNVTAVRLDHGIDGEGGEKFIISSISYYLWLKQVVSASEVFLDRKRRLEMFLVSQDFSDSIHFLMGNLPSGLEIHLVKYRVLEIEGLDEIAIYFQHISFERPSRDKRIKGLRGRQEETPESPEISDQELREFNRLKKIYLE